MKVYKLLVFFVLIVISPKILRGQEREDFSDYGPKMSVKMNVIAFVDFFEPTLSFSFEHRLIGKHYLEHELGYIYANPWKLPKELRGFRYRLGYHYVYDANPFQYKYVGVQFHYRQLFGDIEEFIWRKNFAYQEKIKYQNTFHSYGFTVLFGKVHFMGKSSRWFTDYQFGFGLSWKPFTIENYPTDAENPEFASWIYNSRAFKNNGTTLTNGENPLYTNMLMTIKVGYMIR
jgi:hypothetical protein